MEILQTIGLFIQDQILGMKWLNALIGNLVTALGLDTASHVGGSILSWYPPSFPAQDT